MAQRLGTEIHLAVEGLEALKEKLPEVNGFGTPNHLIIDLQKELIEGKITLEELYEMEGDHRDGHEITGDIIQDVYLAQQWLEGDIETSELLDE